MISIPFANTHTKERINDSVRITLNRVQAHNRCQQNIIKQKFVEREKNAKKNKIHDKSRVVERAQWLCKIISDIRDRAKKKKKNDHIYTHLYTQ